MSTVPFHEVQFPTKISYDYSGGPSYKTIVVQADSADEQRLPMWSGGRLKYTISAGEQKASDAKALITFFRARRGKAFGFRFKDFNDYTAVAEPLGIGYNSSGTAIGLQLQKTYTDIANNEIRTISKPVQGTTETKAYTGIKLYHDTGSGPVLVSSGSYTVDYTTGIITGQGTNPAGYTADFEFDVPCRFDTDEMQLGRESQQVYNWNDIPIVEVYP